MTTIIKTFFIEEEICPNEINEKLKILYSNIKNNCSKGNLYWISEGEIVRYDMDKLFEIFTYNTEENYQIKSELEKIFNIKLVEPN